MQSGVNVTAVIDCNSAEELLEQTSTIGPRLGSLEPGSWLFRGQSDQSWPLSPSSLRQGAFQSIFANNPRYRDPQREIDQYLAEYHTLMRFIRAVDSIGLPIPDDSVELRDYLAHYLKILEEYQVYGVEQVWPPRRVWAPLALARHSGLPTRLLDWTTNERKAAYFAASGLARRINQNKAAQSTKLAVWAIDKDRFSSPAFVNRIYIDDVCPTGITFFSVPAAANPNAHAQQGWFTVVRNYEDSLGGVHRQPIDERLTLDANQIDPKLVKTPLLFKFTLPVTECNHLLYLLRHNGISAATVFPNFAGCANSLEEDHLATKRAEKTDNMSSV